LAGALWGAVLCLALIFRRQWTDNERLPYPLATVYLSLIEPPRPGHALNPLLRSRAFWIAAAAVFLTHCLNGLHAYYPQYFPEMPVNFDLSAILANPPFVWIEGSFKAQTVFFTIVGITYFVRSSLSFSIWFIFTALQGVRMIYGARQVDFTGGMETDQMCGAMLAVGATLLFIARHHLFSVFRQMFTGHRPGQPRGRYLPYAFVGWAFVACLATLVLWLMAAGTTLAGALVIVGLLMLLMLLVMRIVAEGGLLYVLLPIPLNRPWVYLAQDVPTPLSGHTTLRSFFFATFFSGMFTHDTREALAGFAPNALRVIDADVDEHEPLRSRWLWPVILWLAVALAVAFVVGGGASLWAHYNYAATLDSRQDNPIGAWGSYLLPRFELDDTAQYIPPRGGPVESHSRPTHLFIGAGLASTLAFLRLRFAWWPLDPLGYLLVYSWGVRQIWFSIFLGWLAKKLLVSYGGTNLYRSARPAFLGLIIGETVAAGLWLILSFCLAIQGREYHMIRLLPL
jgi:hypothetical protein